MQAMSLFAGAKAGTCDPPTPFHAYLSPIEALRG